MLNYPQLIAIPIPKRLTLPSVVLCYTRHACTDTDRNYVLPLRNKSAIQYAADVPHTKRVAYTFGEYAKLKLAFMAERTYLPFSINRLTARFLALLPVLLLGAWLRFNNLEAQSLWEDELYSWQISHLATPWQVIEAAQQDVHPPGYQLVMWGWQRLLGQTAFALRAFSAFCGILSLAALWQVGHNWLSAKAAWRATLLMAVLWFPLYYSQEARSYSLLLLLTLFSVLFAFAGQRYRWHYGISLACLPWVHYFGILVFVGHGVGWVVYFIVSKRLWWGRILLLGIAFLPFGGWIPNLLGQFSREQSGFWIPNPQPFWVQFVTYFWFFFNRKIEQTYWMMALLAFGVVASLVIPNQRLLRRRWAGIWLVAWLLLPAGLVYWASLYGFSVLTERNLIICLPAAYLLAGLALAYLPNRWLNLTISLALVVFFFRQLYTPNHYWREPSKTQYTPAMHTVLQDISGSWLLAQTPDLSVVDYYWVQAGQAPAQEVLLKTSTDWQAVQAAVQTHQPAVIWYLHSRGERLWQGDVPFAGYENIPQPAFFGLALYRFERTNR